MSADQLLRRVHKVMLADAPYRQAFTEYYAEWLETFYLVQDYVHTHCDDEE